MNEDVDTAEMDAIDALITGMELGLHPMPLPAPAPVPAVEHENFGREPDWRES